MPQRLRCVGALVSICYEGGQFEELNIDQACLPRTLSAEFIQGLSLTFETAMTNIGHERVNY